MVCDERWAVAEDQPPGSSKGAWMKRRTLRSRAPTSVQGCGGTSQPRGLRRSSSGRDSGGQRQLSSWTLVPAGSTHPGDHCAGVAKSPSLSSAGVTGIGHQSHGHRAAQLEVLVEKEGGVQRGVNPVCPRRAAAWQAAVPRCGVSGGEAPLPLPPAWQRDRKGSKPHPLAVLSVMCCPKTSLQHPETPLTAPTKPCHCIPPPARKLDAG